MLPSPLLSLTMFGKECSFVQILESCMSLAVSTIPPPCFLCSVGSLLHAIDATLQSSSYLSTLAVIGKAGRHYRRSAKSLAGDHEELLN